MNRRAFGGLAIALAAGLAGLSPASAQTFPSRPIRVISPFPPGLADLNKWQVYVDNRPGAGGTIGLADARKSEPTGYDLVVGQMDNLVIAPGLSRVNFDTIKDFAPIGLIGTSPIVLVASKTSRLSSFDDAVREVKAEPGRVTLGSAGQGTLAHLLIELMRVRTGIQFRHVPYRGSTPAMQDILGGHLDIAGVSIASALPLIRSGDVRALAVSGAARSATLPDVPTLGQLGLSGVEVSTWYGLLGPAGVPEDILAVLNAQVNRIVQRPDVAATLAEQGLEPAPMSPAQFAAFIREDYAKWQATMAELGFKRE
jgi:tripartite-type tricarboxylate transporter receptor subunit TctC